MAFLHNLIADRMLEKSSNYTDLVLIKASRPNELCFVTSLHCCVTKTNLVIDFIAIGALKILKHTLLTSSDFNQFSKCINNGKFTNITSMILKYVKWEKPILTYDM